MLKGLIDFSTAPRNPLAPGASRSRPSAGCKSCGPVIWPTPCMCRTSVPTIASRTTDGTAAYAAVPSVVLLAIVGTLVLHMQGVGQITGPQDLQPALGLDLLAPGAKGFLGAVLKSINPFSIWGLVLTAIGVSTTHRLSKQTGYMVATVAFLIGVIIAGGAAAVFKR